MIDLKKHRSAVKIEVWTFYVSDNILYLDGYVLAEKESTRHRKYKDMKRYERLSGRNSTIAECEVPFDSEIRDK